MERFMVIVIFLIFFMLTGIAFTSSTGTSISAEVQTMQSAGY